MQLVALLGIAAPSLSQNPHQPLYQGAQPSLVQGVQEGAATGKPKIRHLYLAAPDVLALVVDAGQMWAGAVQPYLAQPGDEIRRKNPQPYGTRGGQFFWNRSILRQGQVIGDVVGPKEDHYTPVFRLEGEPLNVEWAAQADNYTVSSRDDAAGNAQKPLAVFRKSNPQMWEWTDKGKEESTVRHEIYLKLPRALTPGKRYNLDFGAGGQFTAPISFVFGDARLRTEAIQVNQNGYHPRGRERVARLFQWLGDGGGVDFSGLKAFQIVEDKSGKIAFNGEVKLLAAGNPKRKMAPERTADPDNDLPAPLYQLDFSAFNTPGTYRVVVPGLGTSFPFAINQNVWEIAARNAATGFYNQRSGLDLVAPYTRRPMPRTMHPADGFKVHKTDASIFYDPTQWDNTKGLGNAFKRIQASILEDETEPNAWGGWHDAADYDRSILPQGHMRAVHAMLDVYESNPTYFKQLKFNLPENGNAIPDIIDEALWCTDLFLRIQQPDGGVPSAVESIEHPSEPGWLVKQPTAITPSSPQTCWLYAAAAAQMSLVLEKYDPARAKTYRDSALRAMDWAAKNPQIPNLYGGAAQHQNWAAFNLFRLTGESKWHDEFRRTLSVLFPDGDFSKAGFGSYSAVASYALLGAGKADPGLQKACRDALLKVADAKVAGVSKLHLGVRSERYNWDERLGQSWELIAAHRLTGERPYVDAMEHQAQFGLGLNPSNASYTTGIGSREVVPFDFSARYTGGAYPDGISTQGPGPRNIWRGSRTEEKLDRAGIYPQWENWPWAESNFGMREPPMNEHVVGGNMTNILMTRAYLAMAMAREGA